MAETAEGTQHRTLALRGGSIMFIVFGEGVKEGDEVVLDPLAFVEEARSAAAKASFRSDGMTPRKSDGLVWERSDLAATAPIPATPAARKRPSNC